MFLKIIVCASLLAMATTSHAQETDWKNPIGHGDPATTGSKEFLVISRGGEAGPYQAFPDATRLANGDIVAVFYSGYGHVSLAKPGWEKGGRLAMVRSSDEGTTWTAPKIIFDDERDNRDPHITELNDGTLLVTFFSLVAATAVDGQPTNKRETSGTEIIASHDGGATWSAPRAIAPGWYVSAPVRQLKDGTCLLGIYGRDPETQEKQGAVLVSKDNGKTWSEPRRIGAGQNLPVDAETDVIELNDGRVFAAMRTHNNNMYLAYSKDKGETWEPAFEADFRGHAPHFTRLSGGEILMTHRLPDTSLHVSRDDTRTWEGPYQIDNVFGGYAATVELKDGTVLVIYYTEGDDSHVRARRFELKPDGPHFLPITNR